MAFLDLVAKAFYIGTDNLSHEHFAELQLQLIVKSIESLPKIQYPCLLPPNTHDLLASIGEAFCIIVETNSSQHEQATDLVKTLLAISDEYSTNLMRGLLCYLKNRDPDDSTNENQVEKKTQLGLSFFQITVPAFKEKMFHSILDWKQINNYINFRTVSVFVYSRVSLIWTLLAP